MNHNLLVDAGLADLIVNIKHAESSYNVRNYYTGNVIDYTARSPAVRVGEALLKPIAILLPQLYVTFKLEVDSR